MKKISSGLMSSLLALFLVSCGEEGSGNYIVNGSGSSSTSTSSLELANKILDPFSLEPQATLNPSELLISVYEFWISSSKYCTDPIMVYQNTSPDPVDFLGTTTPEVARGFVTDGGYECVIMVMSDNISYKAAATQGACTAGVTVTSDVCQNNGGSDDNLYSPDPLSLARDEACFSGEQLVPVYLSTTATGDPTDGNTNTFRAPTADDTSNGVSLNGLLTVAGSSVSSFVVDGTAKIQDSNCDMQPPTFGFE